MAIYQVGRLNKDGSFWNITENTSSQHVILMMDSYYHDFTKASKALEGLKTIMKVPEGIKVYEVIYRLASSGR